MIVEDSQRVGCRPCRDDFPTKDIILPAPASSKTRRFKEIFHHVNKRSLPQIHCHYLNESHKDTNGDLAKIYLNETIYVT